MRKIEDNIQLKSLFEMVRRKILTTKLSLSTFLPWKVIFVSSLKILFPTYVSYKALFDIDLLQDIKVTYYKI